MTTKANDSVLHTVYVTTEKDGTKRLLFKEVFCTQFSRRADNFAKSMEQFRHFYPNVVDWELADTFESSEHYKRSAAMRALDRLTAKGVLAYIEERRNKFVVVCPIL